MLGILSLITWALIVVVTLKYVVVVMRADNRGEGGVLALMALVSRQPAINPRRRRIYLILGMLGAALFYGDCLLTPAISVLSAVEGLKVATPALDPAACCPISIGVLVVPVRRSQRSARRGVGSWFGPITLVWFIVPASCSGLRQIVDAPQVLWAFLPHHALAFAFQHGIVTLFALGAVTLAVTGARGALCRHGPFRPHADPPRLAAAGAAGAARQLLRPGRAAAEPTRAPSSNPFFRLAPEWALFPLVALATIATVIASQATISGAFSMAQQSALLGLERAHPRRAHVGERVRPDLRARGELAAAGRRGRAGGVLQVVDQPRRRLRHRRHRHHAGHHRPGVRAGGARLEMAVVARHSGVHRLPGGRRHAAARPTC